MLPDVKPRSIWLNFLFNTCNTSCPPKHTYTVVLSHDVASGSDITLCNKIDKSLVVYIFSRNVMSSIITLRKIWQNLEVLTPKCEFYLI